MIIVNIIVRFKLLYEDISLKGSEDEVAMGSQSGRTWASVLLPDKSPASVSTPMLSLLYVLSLASNTTHPLILTHTHLYY